MALILKLISCLYLILVWTLFFVVLVFGPDVASIPNRYGHIAETAPIFFIICSVLSIPAVALYAFGQIVGDVRASRLLLEAMRERLTLK
jgi:hypothetical protein